MDDDTWLDEAQCWDYLRAERVGRLGYHLVDEVHIVPVHYVVDGQRLVFRTMPGSKLLGVVMDDDVAFEIDSGQDEQELWSVLARGRARILEGDERREAEQLGIGQWSDHEERLTFVAIDVQTVTGRRLPPHSTHA